MCGEENEINDWFELFGTTHEFFICPNQVRKRTISLSSSSESSDEDEDEASRGEDARMLRKSKRSPTAVKLRKCPICKIEVGVFYIVVL